MHLRVISFFILLNVGAASRLRDAANTERSLAIQYDSQASSCAVVLCPAPSVCVEKDGKAECVSLDVCQDVTCEQAGQVCVPVDVVCITTPCLPQPTCVDDPCAAVRCGSGTTCQVNAEGNPVCLPMFRPCNLACVSDKPICHVTSTGPTCIASLCDVTDCGAGGSCEIDSDGNPVCKGPCDQITCNDGEECSYDPATGDASCGPIPDVCQDFKCEVEGQICVAQQVFCIRAPCPPIPTCIDDPCALVRCRSGTTCEVDAQGNPSCSPTKACNLFCVRDKPICHVDPITGDVTCIADPCVDVQCGTGSTCEIDAQGQAVCVPTPCNLFCVQDKPICEVDPATGATSCVADPCADVQCDSGSTCQVDADGNAVCLKLERPCNLLCVKDKPICIVDPTTGFPTCVAADDTPTPAPADDGESDPCKGYKCGVDEECVLEQVECIRAPCPPIPSCVPRDQPLWWDHLKTNFVGNRLKRCKGLHNTAPAQGKKCSKGPKTCFFGYQECSNGVGHYPETRCYCDGKKGEEVWTCSDAVCPNSPGDNID